MIIYLTLICFLIGISNGNVQFEPNATLCLNTRQEYECVVTGTPFFAMSWRVFNSSDMMIGSVVTYTSSGFGAIIEFDEFSFQQTDDSPNIVSNVVFTVQYSINDYTIVCRPEANPSLNKSFVITNIPGPPSPPTDVTIHSDTFTNTSVNISWTKSSSPCVTRYRYNVSSVTEGNIVKESTTTNDVFDDERLVQSDEQYCVVVTAIDTANRNSSESSSSCFIFNVPIPPSVVNITNDTQSDTRLEVTVGWMEGQFDVPNTTFVPELLEYRVYIVNTTDPSDYNDTSGLLSPDITEYTFTGVPTGRTYNISVTAINGVGASDSSVELFEAPGPYVDLNPPPPISPSPTVTMTMGTTMINTTDALSSLTSTNPSRTESSLSSTETISPIGSSSPSVSKNPEGSDRSTSVAAIAGGAGGGVGLIFGIIVIVFVVVCCCKMKKSKSVNLVGDSEKFSGDSGTSKPMQLEDTTDMPQIGQPLYQDVSSGGAKTTELATYQDPSTIRREQAPGSNDLYALPEKKKSEVELPPQGQMYAELDLPNKTSSDNKTTVVVPGTTTEPVIYSDVRGQ